MRQAPLGDEAEYIERTTETKGLTMFAYEIYQERRNEGPGC